MNNLDLSIIIVASKSDFLENCLKSLAPAIKEIPNEIIIIDNVTQDKIGEKLKKKFPEIKVIRREVNGGFGENNNMGMKIAKGKYILLLNDDTKIINNNILKEMIDWMNEHPRAGLSTCALLNADLKTYQGSGGSFPTLFRVIAWMTFFDDIPIVDKLIKPYHPMHSFSPIYKNQIYFKQPHKQDWITGAYYLMRKEAMDQVGYFDEDFFLYVEEVELSYRFAKAGWEVWYLPKWKIVHYGSATIGSERALMYEMNNIVLFYKKHMPKWQIPILKFFLRFGSILRVFVFGILKGPKAAKTYLKTFLSIK